MEKYLILKKKKRKIVMEKIKVIISMT